MISRQRPLDHEAGLEVKRLKFLISVIFRLEKKAKKVVEFSGVFDVCRRGIRRGRDHALRRRRCA